MPLRMLLALTVWLAVPSASRAEVTAEQVREAIARRHQVPEEPAEQDQGRLGGQPGLAWWRDRAVHAGPAGSGRAGGLAGDPEIAGLPAVAGRSAR